MNNQRFTMYPVPCTNIRTTNTKVVKYNPNPKVISKINNETAFLLHM